MALNFDTETAARVRQVYIVSGLRQGLSGNQIIDTLRALGLGQRTSTMQAQIASLVGRPGELPSLDGDTLKQLYEAQPTVNYVSRSSKALVYSFDISGRDLLTGKDKTVTLSIQSDFVLLPDMAQSLFLQNVDFQSSGGIEPDPSTIVSYKPRKYTPFTP